MCQIKPRIFWLVFLAFIVSGCAETRFMATGKNYESWQGPVKILLKPPKGVKYEEIGWISGKMGGMVSDWGAILKAMQKSARKKGANAIILVNKETSTQSSFGGSIQYGFYGGSYQDKNLMAIAIRILD